MLSTEALQSVTPTNSTKRAKKRARSEAQRQASYAKDEFGRMVADAVEEYFPEETRARRRRMARRAFFAGVAVGFLLGNALRRP